MKYKTLYIAILTTISVPTWGLAETAVNDTLRTIESTSNVDAPQIVERKTTNKSTDTLDAVTVYGDVIALDGIMTDEQGYDAVYDDNYSSDFVGKKRIDTYRGTSTADVLQSFTGVYSGDARNSGAIDPNVRGLQGEGRVPVRIDGTEQAVTANRGYAGANNRNYIDPMLIGGIRVVKDSGLDTGVKTGVGGGIEIRTLNVNDFIKDEGFGGEIRIEMGSNAIAPSIDKDYDGEKMVDIPNATIENGEWNTDKLYIQPISKKDSGDEFNLLKGKNYAGRIALGYKAEHWDVMGAVSKRTMGNYFTGKKGADYYSDEVIGDGYDQDIIHVLANYYPTGTEALNTSSKNTSYLFKAGFKPAEDQKIALNYRNTQSEYGEVMPSYLRRYFENGHGMQIPLSTVDVKATSLQYALNPSDNDWVDLKANIWHTKSTSDTYNSAGALVSVKNNGTQTQQVCNGMEFMGVCYDNNFVDIGYDISTDELKDDYLVNNAKVKTKHTRYGVDLSNKMQVSDSVDVTLFGTLQKENMKQSVDELGQDWAQYPREGSRQEWAVGFNTHWQATDKLSFDAGGQYSSYHLKDDLRASNDDDLGLASQESVITYTYYKETDEYLESMAEIENETGFFVGHKKSVIDEYNYYMSQPVGTNTSFDENGRNMTADEYYKNNIEWFRGRKLQDYGKATKIVWEPDSRGNYSRANNPCYNGTIANLKGAIKAEGLIDPVNCPAIVSDSTELQKYSESKPMKEHAFTPSLAVNYQFNDDAQIYARYNESVRYPNSYEGMFGFLYIPSVYGIAPERSHKFELGYAHNLTNLIPNADVADIKVAYYQNNIEDYIDKVGLTARNLDKKKTSGLELQGRYDNGKFFGDIGINHVLKNEVCDEHLGVMQEYLNDHKNSEFSTGPHKGKRCFTDGVPSSHSITSSVPTWSAKLHLGGRFLNDKLEAGTRLTYHNGNNNEEYWKFLDGINKSDTNTPYGWDKTFLVDAYLRYKLNKNVEVELSGQNLTDRFYVDPASRTPMAAPGRMIKLNMTGRF